VGLGGKVAGRPLDRRSFVSAWPIMHPFQGTAWPLADANSGCPQCPAPEPVHDNVKFREERPHGVTDTPLEPALLNP
jgi:hypothetical protein